MANIHTIHDFAKARPSPWAPFNLRTRGNHALLARRLCILTVLLSNATGSGSIGWRHLQNRDPTRVAITGIFMVFEFLWFSWALQAIADVEGSYKVFGVTLKRWHFDLVLAFVTVSEVFINATIVMGRYVQGVMVFALSVWFLVALGYWTCRRVSEQELPF